MAFPLRIAVFTGAGTTSENFRCLQSAFLEAERVRIDAVTPAEIIDGDLLGFDVVVFPGGSGGAQARALGIEGAQKVIRFVELGGGYLGICGGAFLAVSQYDWSLGLLNAKTLTSPLGPSGDPRDSLWYRGDPATVSMELSEAGVELLAGRQPNEPFPVLYHNGPIFSDGADSSLPPFDVLARYRSEIWRSSGQKGTMVNSPAIIASPFQDGRVMAIGPHLESDPANYGLLSRAIDWVGGGRAA